MKNRLRKFFRWLPVSWKARIDFAFDKSLGKEFGGPFNGQVFRQNIFKDLVKLLPLEAIVETGTFRGVTTGFMAAESGLPVFTVEAEPRFYYYAKLNVRRHKKVHVLSGDSRKFMEKLAQDHLVPRQNVFFYLDAHWQEDLPLFKEIELIAINWKNVIIMIDDFEVPDDNGYQYDNYGEGKRLNLDYIQSLLGNTFVVFFPSVRAAQETGFKRGCVVLASKEWEEKIKEVSSLRSYSYTKPATTI